ncbi:MAG: UDP-N-acetyl-2-amino-2-deoxyglucuronate dehydrogenase [Desulforhopalus sp.]|jgi:UDP-N-acetyl-2-amino-2-deoxyglucuronate dehydrogenase
MGQEKIRFGIAGPGSIGHSHSLAIQQVQNAELVSVLGRDTLKTAEFAAKYGITPHTNVDQFLQPDDIDAITIATPSGAHLEIALQAAQKGIHVLCEKPLEVTGKRAQVIIDACKESDTRLSVIYQARFDPCTTLAKTAIDAGRLGKILLASCQMRWSRSQAYYDSAAWRGTWDLDGGGCLMNQGIHSIDLLLHLVGQPVAVSAFQGPVTHQRIEVEDNLCATVRFESGAIGTIEASTSCSPGLPRKIEISGERGAICIEDNRIVCWKFEEELPGDDEIRNQFARDLASIGGAASPTVTDVTGHLRIVEDFICSVRDERPPCVSGDEGKRSVDFICAAYESIRQGGAVVQLV